MKDVVVNDWEMENGNICIFIGLNMVGKFMILKVIVFVVWLVYVGFLVLVFLMVCFMFDGIFIFINLLDFLRDGCSYFYVEVLRVKEVLE